MATPTRAPIPADASDELVRRLYTENAWSVPAGERRTCDEHFDWRDRCADEPHTA